MSLYRALNAILTKPSQELVWNQYNVTEGIRQSDHCRFRLPQIYVCQFARLSVLPTLVDRSMQVQFMNENFYLLIIYHWTSLLRVAQSFLFMVTKVTFLMRQFVWYNQNIKRRWDKNAFLLVFGVRGHNSNRDFHKNMFRKYVFSKAESFSIIRILYVWRHLP